MKPLFLDSAFIIALVFERDQNHAAAQAEWTRVTNERRTFVTTTFVFDEAITYLNNRGEHALAVSTGNQLLTSPTFDVQEVTGNLIKEAWDFFIRHSDKRYSFTDCVSFVVMNDRGLPEALTFDDHFQQAGFNVMP